MSEEITDPEFSYGLRTRWFSTHGFIYPDKKRTDLFVLDKENDHWRAVYNGERWIYDNDWTTRDEFDQLMRERMDIAIKNVDDLHAKEDEQPGPVIYDDYDEDIEQEIAAMKAPNEELEVNEKGGKQTKLPTRFDLIPQAAQHKVAAVLSEGNDKYGERNWRKIDERSHLNHALAHLNAFLFHRAEVHAGRTPADKKYLDEELSHAAARVLMALEIHLTGEDDE